MTLPLALRVEQIEAHLEQVIARQQISADAITGISALVEDAVNNLLAADRDVKSQLQKQFNKLEAQEERLIELAATGSLPMSKIRSRIEHTSLQKEAIKEKLEFTVERLRYGGEKAIAYLSLMSYPGAP
ncbi:hypothetical protein [Microbacterium phyllosphaerae]|uniref:hypothetical protein n=1 Tax=Microbacterium phyllosphaerae TaxID=124798 RepID=UPI000EA21C15|nr:hypothetical protein [Microbacterium phyllosphaerae]